MVTDDYLVDLGAQWIDGERGNVANDLASPLNLTDHPMPNMPFNFKTYTSSGELIDPAVDHNITDVHVHIYDYVDTTSKECQTSVGECFTHKYKEHFKKIPELNETLQDQFLRQYNLMEMSLQPADTWFDIEMSKKLENAEATGHLLINWKERGYSTILDILMKKFPNPEEELPVLNKTMLNVEVTKVDYSNEDGTVKVITNDGKEHTADHVIMTPSLGVLKADHETMFNPPLPENKVKNIKGIGFGNACKIYLAFNNSWFNPLGLKNGGYNILWSTEDIT
ncbi:probable polyamine oxidase 5, partial [Ceratina calcarata]|uniref:Probable polyamine oxidase 5 n=1 Tax=Ceratina calcarata TaxID=156304 RepID=A0AAJ7JES9_9HYME